MIDCPVLLGNTDVLFFLPAHAMLCMRGDSTALFRHTPPQASASTTCCTSSRTAFLNWCRTKKTFEPLQSTIRRTKSARSAPRASFAWLLQDSHAPFKVLCCLASSEAERCQWRAVRRPCAVSEVQIRPAAHPPGCRPAAVPCQPVAQAIRAV